jgi:phage FluMu protein Com
MITFHGNTCDRCKRVNPIDFQVEPADAWRTVVLNRWRKLCPSCFDLLAEQAGVAYTFTDLVGQSWSQRPVPRGGGKRGRQMVL